MILGETPNMNTNAKVALVIYGAIILSVIAFIVIAITLGS